MYILTVLAIIYYSVYAKEIELGYSASKSSSSVTINLQKFI